MAWIKLVSDGAAQGRLAKAFEAARARAGRVFNIVRLMSPNPAVLDSSMRLYVDLMRGPSPLTRTQREMIATLVSRANACHY